MGPAVSNGEAKPRLPEPGVPSPWLQARDRASLGGASAPPPGEGAAASWGASASCEERKEGWGQGSGDQGSGDRGPVLPSPVQGPQHLPRGPPSKLHLLEPRCLGCHWAGSEPGLSCRGLGTLSRPWDTLGAGAGLGNRSEEGGRESHSPGASSGREGAEGWGQSPKPTRRRRQALAGASARPPRAAGSRAVAGAGRQPRLSPPCLRAQSACYRAPELFVLLFV